jgi:hypothetical protein
MRLASVVLVLLWAVLASACGGGDGAPSGAGDAQSEIERDVRAFALALSDNEMPNAYTYLSKDCKETVSLDDFMGSMLLARAFIGEDWELEITGVDILEHEGDRAVIQATAVFRVDGEEIESEETEEDEPETWVREDGKWRITDCEDFKLDGDGGGFAEQESTAEPEDLITVIVGESFDVAAEDLGELYGEDSPSGTISIRVTDAETRATIASEFEGPQTARGKFVVVYYEVVSDLNRRMQPGTQINDNLALTDEREREWEVADYEGDYYGISGDAADLVRCDAPEGWIGAGFTGCTAAVFDVPSDAKGFTLLWKDAGVSIGLEPLNR